MVVTPSEGEPSMSPDRRFNLQKEPMSDNAQAEVQRPEGQQDVQDLQDQVDALQHTILELQAEVSSVHLTVCEQHQMLQNQQEQQERQQHQINYLQNVLAALSAQAQQQQYVQYAGSAASSATTPLGPTPRPLPPTPLGPPPPPLAATRCVHSTTGNIRLDATCSMGDGNEVKDTFELDRCMTHLNATLFSGDNRCHTEMWNRCQRAFLSGDLRILWCATKANRFVMFVCPHCDSYTKADHGHYIEHQEIARQRANLLVWIGIVLPPGLPRVCQVMFSRSLQPPPATSML